MGEKPVARLKQCIAVWFPAINTFLETASTGPYGHEAKKNRILVDAVIKQYRLDSHGSPDRGELGKDS